MCIWYWVYRCRLARKRLNFQICSSSLEWRCPGPTLACQDVGKLQCSEKLSTRRRLFKKRTYCGHDAVLGRWVMLTDRCYTLTCARWFRWLAAPTVSLPTTPDWLQLMTHSHHLTLRSRSCGKTLHPSTAKCTPTQSTTAALSFVL